MRNATLVLRFNLLSLDMEEVNITIIGAGVIGLAVAAGLSERYENIIVLERHGSFGREISSRNSEVIHAGIYYPAGSQKARLCVQGAKELYEICKEYSIPHKRTGKLIVAVEQAEAGALEEIFNKGNENGVSGLELLDRADVKKIEPDVNAIAAIYSPNTGIIDSHALMKYFLKRAEDNGVITAFNSEVEQIDKKADGFLIGIKQHNYKFKTKIVINCAGLSSDSVAGSAGVDVHKNKYKLKFCKGSYFSYAKPSPVGVIIYPVPQKELTGLGIHATLDLGGRLRFGPDTEYVDQIDYDVDAGKRDRFYESVSKIISHLDKDAFMPDMAGVRPKLYGKDEPVRDFVITDEKENGLPGLIDLIGIESPGLTASLAIARDVGLIISDGRYI